MLLGVHVAKKSKVVGPGYDDKKRKTRKTMLTAIKEDLRVLKLNVAQIYTHGPRNSKMNKIDHAELKEYVESKEITLIVHSPHVTPGPLWKVSRKTIRKPKDGDSSNVHATKTKNRFIVRNYIEQLRCAKDSGASYLVLHLPDMPVSKMVPAWKIISHYANKYEMFIVLENIPVRTKKNEVSSAEAINNLCNTFSKYSTTYWGLCIDTAHIWSCGIDLSGKMEQTKWFKDLSDQAKQSIKLFHLNGSKCETFNHSRDKHFIAMSPEDDMYSLESKKVEELGISVLVKFAAKHSIPIVCEINRGYEKHVKFSLNKIKQLV